ncbi:MAG: type IV pilus biogenesis/stability protein PilW [Gammaproteobacteria bacterium]|nr:type IV pilus biogenesis/stability protein PilW [Gammaproteobacteria bacterium]MBU1414317.1 type IV pilus biogenesis/stability protein PilW [Gammaproteobacteria bacterium]
MTNIHWFVVVLTGLLAGCGSIPQGRDGEQQTPVSQQEVVGEARRAAKAHADLGMAYMSQGQLSIALDEARKAVEADASYPLGHNVLGLVQMYLKENRAAEESFDRALQLAPGDPEINNNYGWFLCQTGREGKSIAYFETASKNTLFATPTKPLTNAAMCSIMVGDDRNGEAFLRRALTADPRNSDAIFLLTELYYRTDRAADARVQLANLHELVAPTAQSVWLGLRIERALGDRSGERRYGMQLRRDFRDSREYQFLKQGIYQ